jgi:chemotaxis protein histidine kinase CheA
MENKSEFYKETWFMWASLVIFAPVGIFLMWKYSQLKENAKIILSVVFSVIFVMIWVPSCVGLGNNNSEKKAEQQLSDNKQIVQEVEKKINTIGDPKTVTIDKSQTVNDAKTAYNELTNEQKGMVSYSSLKILVIADDNITTLESKATADKAAADKAAADKAAAEKAAADQAAADKVAADKAAAEQAAADQAAAQASQNTASVSSSSSASQSSSETTETTVYITNTGEKYHTSGCSSLSKSKIPIDLAKAKAEGYTACSKCHPPQ